MMRKAKLGIMPGSDEECKVDIKDSTFDSLKTEPTLIEDKESKNCKSL